MSSEVAEIKRLRKESLSGVATGTVISYMANNFEFDGDTKRKIFQSARNLVDSESRSRITWEDFARAIRLYKLEGKFYEKKSRMKSPEEKKKEIKKEMDELERKYSFDME